MLKQKRQAHALNHFLKKPACVAPMAPMTVPSRGKVLLCAGQTVSSGSEPRARPTHLTSKFKVLVTSIAGAPSDGAISLTTAIEQELSSRGVELSDRVTVGAYRVQALVVLGPSKNGQSLHVEWILTDPSGKK